MSTKTINVKVFKMVTGEEIVADLTYVSTDSSDTIPQTYRIANPLVLRMQPVAPGKVGLTFVPWVLAAPEIDEVKIPAVHVVTVLDVAQHIKDEYIKQVNPSSIEVPKPKLIIP